MDGGGRPARRGLRHRERRDRRQQGQQPHHGGHPAAPRHRGDRSGERGERLPRHPRRRPEIAGSAGLHPGECDGLVESSVRRFRPAGNSARQPFRDPAGRGRSGAEGGAGHREQHRFPPGDVRLRLRPAGSRTRRQPLPDRGRRGHRDRGHRLAGGPARPGQSGGPAGRQRRRAHHPDAADPGRRGAGHRRVGPRRATPKGKSGLAASPRQATAGIRPKSGSATGLP